MNAPSFLPEIQTALGVSADGRLGPITWNAIYQRLTGRDPLHSDESLSDAVTTIQRALDFSAHACDGLAGPATWAAIRLAVCKDATEPAATATAAGNAAATAIIIGEDHWLIGVERVPLPAARALLNPLYVVEHFTGGADGDGDTNGDHIKDAYSAVDAMRDRAVSAHIVVDRDGSVVQCVPFNRKASHAGVSRWRNPRTRSLYRSEDQFGGNDLAIGIEIANAGSDAGALAWARKQPGFQSILARHRNGGKVQEWECFSPAQIAKVKAITRALVQRYHLVDVTGHDCIAPERKDDPGPAFPMQEIREACGFSGLPEVNQK